MLQTYDGTRKNDAALLWCRKARHWVTRYESVTKSKLSDEQAVDLVADSLIDKARAWWNNIVDSNKLQADDFPGYAV